MKKLSCSGALLLFAVQGYANVCDIALASRAYDTRESTVSDNIAYEKRDALCRQSYSSLEEARTSARSSGFNIGYSNLSIGGNGTRRNSSGRWEISSTEFCTASAEQFQRAYAASYREQVGNIALNAWLECIKSTSASKLFLAYEVDRNGKSFFGTLIRTASTGSLASSISGISVVGPAAGAVKCNIGGNEFTPQSIRSSRYPITETQTAIACWRDSDEDVSVAIQTDEGSLPYVKLPSSTTSEQIRYESLLASVQQHSAQLNSLSALLVQDRAAAALMGSGALTLAEGSKKLDRDTRSVSVSFTLNQNALLIAALQGNNMGPGNTGKQHVEFVSVRIDLNDATCARDFSGLFVWDGHGFSNAVCLTRLEAGTHQLKAEIGSSAWPETKGELHYYVIPLRTEP